MKLTKQTFGLGYDDSVWSRGVGEVANALHLASGDMTRLLSNTIPSQKQEKYTFMLMQ